MLNAGLRLRRRYGVPARTARAGPATRAREALAAYDAAQLAASMDAAAAGTSKALRDGTLAGTGGDTFPAPWYTHGDTGWVYETEDARNPLVIFADPEHAKRVVACVNACAGIPTELLESLELGELDAAVRDPARDPSHPMLSR